MIHHDNRDYKVASGEAAKFGRDKLEKMIEDGKAQASKVIEGVLSRVIQDVVVKRPLVKVRKNGTNWEGFIAVGNDSAYHRFHDHAFDQLLESTIGKKMFNDFGGAVDVAEHGQPPVVGSWGDDLIRHNINTVLEHRDPKARNLVRMEEGVVKGWLSDRFRRLDSRPLLESFVTAAKQMDLVPIQGMASDTKARLRAVLPQVFEPLPNEVMVFGLEWGNSDYGDGGHVVNLWTMRVYCSNLAIAEQSLRQVHLGKRLDDNIQYSQKTYELDTQTNASALRDVVRHAIGAERLNPLMDSIAKTQEQEIKGKDVAALLKKHLEKTDAERVQQLFESHDNANMPAGENIWRLSNAISWLANDDKISVNRKLELQSAAGAILGHKQHKPMEA